MRGKANELETAILEALFCELEGRSRDMDVIIESRTLSGAGFFTKFPEQAALKLNVDSDSEQWGNVGARLNGTVDTGYIVYFEDGFVSMLEGYCYDGDWPDKISSFETYKI